MVTCCPWWSIVSQPWTLKRNMLGVFGVEHLQPGCFTPCHVAPSAHCCLCTLALHHHPVVNSWLIHCSYCSYMQIYMRLSSSVKLHRVKLISSHSPIIPAQLKPLSSWYLHYIYNIYIYIIMHISIVLYVYINICYKLYVILSDSKCRSGSVDSRCSDIFGTVRCAHARNSLQQ